MESVILAVVLLIIIGAAVIYIVREKKRGVKCIGCPYAQQCASRGKCSGGEEYMGSHTESKNRTDEA